MARRKKTSQNKVSSKKTAPTKAKSRGKANIKAKGISFPPCFVAKSENPYEQVRWTKRQSVIQGTGGEIVFRMDDVEVPESWSQLATDIAASKYFRKAGIKSTGHETSVRQLVHRVANTIRKAGESFKGYFATSSDAQQFEKELVHILLQQKGAFNSPVWFNCGLFHEYGIKSSGGNWAWSAKHDRPVVVENSYASPQCSACFILSVDDDLMNIFDLLKTEARIFKYGSGSGTNFSKIRGSMEKLSGGGTSSGLMSFLEVFDRAAGATKSGGTTRRAAKMVCLDVDHPEIREFIDWKSREEKKVAALVAAGYSDDFNGEAYRTVSGQNSNNSVRIPNEFMSAVERDGEWKLRARTDAQVTAKMRARDLWRQIAQAAWDCADPGVQFDSTIQKWHTCPETARINGSNPCSEYMFLDDSACNLASLNLLKFLRDDGSFDVESYQSAARVLFMAQEILVDFSSYPTETIARNSHDFRPLGLGYANLGALLMAKGIAYDSPDALAWTGALTALMQGEAYRTSALIAASKGAFAGYKKNASAMMRVMQMHRDEINKINFELVGSATLQEACASVWSDVIALGKKYGYRNAQVTLLAPTGTIGLLMDCDTTGIEPEFALVKTKKLAGGGSVEIVNQVVARALKKLGYSDGQVTKILAHIAKVGGIEGAPFLRAEHLPIFDSAQPSGGEGGIRGRALAPLAHIRIMAAAQPFLCGAISKTVNLPAETTVDEIESIYKQSWILGLKSVAVYRSGSKLSQILHSGVPRGEVNTASKGVSDSGNDGGTRVAVGGDIGSSSNSSDLAEAPRCGVCGHITVRDGTCFRCNNCGTALSCG